MPNNLREVCANLGNLGKWVNRHFRSPKRIGKLCLAHTVRNPFSMKALNTAMETITSKEDMVLRRLSAFYSDPAVLARVKPIVTGESKISLRLLDWLVTNYAKKHNIAYLTKGGRDVNVYLRYKANLRAYSKKMFDPFCRWKKITFLGMNTTVGQLNFFHWVLEDEVLEYLEAQYDAVQSDMDSCSTTIQPKDGDRRKRHELSRSATKSITLSAFPLSVKFE